MANLTFQAQKTAVTAGGSVTVSDDSQTCDTVLEQSFNIPANQVNGEIDVSIPIANLKGIALGVAQVSGDLGTPGAVTVNTNSTSGTAGGDNRYVLTTTNGILWSAGDNEANPVTADITKFYVDNPNSAQMVLVVKAGYNAGVAPIP